MSIYPDRDTLAEYVRQSNLIEGITAEPGDPLFDDHYGAARLVVVRARDGSGRNRYSPRDLHRIVGAESGPRARPCDLDWIEGIVSQCRAAGTPVFVKQDSGPRPGQQGRIPDELWIREWPTEGVKA